MTTIQITKAQAIEAYEGNASALARALNVSPQAVYQWPEGPIDEGYALKLWFVLKPGVFKSISDIETAADSARAA